jgi:hypothetical protein
MSAVIGVPDGNVTFLDGTSVLGTGKLRGGKASITIGTLPIGQDSIQVVYAGSEFAGSTSGELTVDVRADDTIVRPTHHISHAIHAQLLRRQAVT